MYTGVQQEVKALDGRMNHQENELAALRAQVAALQARQEGAGRRFDIAVNDTPAPGTDLYERPPNPCVLKLNTSDKVAKDVL
eukprot:3088035-Karenia_brevis.AAC.1